MSMLASLYKYASPFFVYRFSHGYSFPYPLILVEMGIAAEQVRESVWLLTMKSEGPGGQDTVRSFMHTRLFPD